MEHPPRCGMDSPGAKLRVPRGKVVLCGHDVYRNDGYPAFRYQPIPDSVLPQGIGRRLGGCGGSRKMGLS